MNIKRIAVSAAAAGVMLSAAMPAFAGHVFWHPSNSDGDALVKIKNWAYVKNVVTTKADTGDNKVIGGGHSFFGGPDINTGAALAGAEVTNVVNTNTVDLCECLGDFDDITVKIKNIAVVKNYVYTKADTGDNFVWGNGDITTGAATAGSIVTNVVNTNTVGGN